MPRAPTSQRSSHQNPEAAAAEAVLLTVALAFVAATIHAVASAEHFSEFWLFGAFFSALAVAQIAWGLWLYARPSTNSLIAGAALNAPVIAVWLLSRSVGVPVGPDAWKPERVGALDLAATVDECLIVVLVYLLAVGNARFDLFRFALRPLAYLVLIGSGVVLLMGGHHAS